jgi:hypothetical protein
MLGSNPVYGRLLLVVRCLTLGNRFFDVLFTVSSLTPEDGGGLSDESEMVFENCNGSSAIGLAVCWRPAKGLSRAYRELGMVAPVIASGAPLEETNPLNLLTFEGLISSYRMAFAQYQKTQNARGGRRRQRHLCLPQIDRFETTLTATVSYDNV